ncbi:hypothetical protein [Symbioplanes lichenis]|uniref:hypothetical protein n=1 Tax=Symbioplanes lichenis TaxID=1629072 RepID=UPI0027396548|nr:hypothetical protein [Actinoplanes lichenis]
MENIGGELLSGLAIFASSLGISGLIRSWIRHRTRLQLERQRSLRTTTRADSLARLARRQGWVRIDEKDQDGHRIVELRGARHSREEETA